MSTTSTSDSHHSIISIRGSSTQSEFLGPLTYCQTPLKTVLSTSVSDVKKSSCLDNANALLGTSGTLSVCSQNESIPSGHQLQPLHAQHLGIVSGALFRQPSSDSHALLNTPCILQPDSFPPSVEHNSVPAVAESNNYTISGNSCPILLKKQQHVQPFVTSCFYSPWL